jgi:hypothetical protein
LWIEVSLRSHFCRNSGRIFCEDSPAFTELSLGSIQVHLDYEDFWLQLWCDVFARLFELVIVIDVIKVDDGQYYKAHYTCYTFNTRRQNTRKGITRIQITPCCKTNFIEDWSLYWFYVKVDMSTISGYGGPAHPLSAPIEALTVVCTTPYNHRAAGIRNCENAFHLASMILGSRDIIE